MLFDLKETVQHFMKCTNSTQLPHLALCKMCKHLSLRVHLDFGKKEGKLFLFDVYSKWL